MEGPHAGISNVEAHVHQLEQRLEDCLAIKANSDDVPSTSQVIAPHPCTKLFVRYVCTAVCLRWT